jgi:CHAD domain-containing protein
MLPIAKWIDGIDAEGTVDAAARRSLEARLTAVIHALPLAAYLAEHDIEHVHRLRVSARRAVAALELYWDWLPRKQAHWLKRRLKKIRRAAGDARDLDVLAKRLARDYGDRAAPVVALVKERRAKVQSAIVDVAERCRRDDRFVRKTSKLLESIKLKKQTNGLVVTFREWAVAQLTASASPFFEGLPDDSADTVALHQFRIRGKELRYTIELVSAAFGPELRKKHYAVVEELQELLGNVQDHVAAMGHMSEWVKDSRDAEQQGLLHELADEEREHLVDAIRDFRSWWTNERVASLRAGLMQPADTVVVTDHPQVVHQT